jgi:prevent-host-death family protein
MINKGVDIMEIRPISDLRNKFTEIEDVVKEGQPVYLTKNGYGSMVVLSLEEYSRLTEDIEVKLDEADKMASLTKNRLSHQELFDNVREGLKGNKDE